MATFSPITGAMLEGSDPRPTAPCLTCNGRGAVSKPVLWSDGWGMCDHTCGVCDGSGKAINLASALIAAKKRANEAEGELRSLRTHLALYLSIIETGSTPQPPLKHATGPSPYADTWLEYLHKAAAKAPRFTATEYAAYIGGGN